MDLVDWFRCNSSASSTAKRKSGMGLDLPAGSNGGHAKREVFAQLDVGDGGDVKRMKR